MARGKKKGGKKDHFADAEEASGSHSAAAAASSVAVGGAEDEAAAGLSKSQLKKQRRVNRKKKVHTSTNDDDDNANDNEEEEEEEIQPQQLRNKMNKKEQQTSAFATLESDEDEEDEVNEEIVQSKATGGGFAALDSDEEEEEEENENEETVKSKTFAADRKVDRKGVSKEAAARDMMKDSDDEMDVLEKDEEDFTSTAPSTSTADLSDSKESLKMKQKNKIEEKKEGKKKLSSKERRRIKEEKEAAEREEMQKQASKPTEFAVSATANKKGEAWENAKDINIPSFTVSAYGKTLFQNAELKIADGRKYGLIGPNGKGKSTLLKLIASGELEIPPLIDCIYVDQEVPADDTPAVEMVLKSDTKRTQLLEREAEIMKILESEESDDLPLEEQDALQSELQEVTNELRARKADAAEAKALSLLTGLGFTKKMLYEPTKNFSGGWRMRVSIARALFLERTLTMLDEPSNHLDLNSSIYLTDVLMKWKKTIILVSHDSSLLESVCTDIVCLEARTLQYYKGSFSQYEKQHEIYREKLKKEFTKQEKDLKAMKQRGVTNKKAAEQIVAKSKREGGGARGGKKSKKVDEAGNEGAGLADKQLLEKPRDYIVKFEFPEPEIEVSGNYISVDEVSFKYEGGKTLFKKLSFGIDKDSRICIVGPNGVGKSTLLKVMTGELEPTKGEVKINRGVRIAKYHQHFLDILPHDLSPVEFLRREHNMSYQEARNVLGKFGLEGSAHVIKLVNCSGGQKSRVVFANMALMKPSILLLDEPTNNLDLESVQALIDGINDFEGAVVLISHDERLIVETECRLWVLENKTVLEWEGGFEEYKDSILDELAKQERERQEKLEEKIRLAAEDRARKMEAITKRKEEKKAKNHSAAPPAPAPEPPKESAS